MECISENAANADSLANAADTNYVTDTHCKRDAQTSHGTGLASSAPSETMKPSKEGKNQVGVSTNYTPSGINRTQEFPSGNNHKQKSQHAASHWFALRTTYGREKKAYDYLVSKGVKVLPYPSRDQRGERRKKSGRGITIAEYLLRTWHRRGIGKICLRQCKPPFPPILLSPLPPGITNHEDAAYRTRLSD